MSRERDKTWGAAAGDMAIPAAKAGASAWSIPSTGRQRISATSWRWSTSTPGIPDQRLATLYYVSGLGLTRDPYLMTSVDNMWANAGKSQFHLPTGNPQVVRGITGLVLPEREALLRRLTGGEEAARGHGLRLQGAQRLRRHRLALGQPHPLPRARARASAAWRSASPTSSSPSPSAPPGGSRASIGRSWQPRRAWSRTARLRRQSWRSARTSRSYSRRPRRELPDFDGHHVQVYLADFSGPYRRLLERGLISQEDDQHQYRFLDIVDLASNRPLFRIEHEVRSMRHPLYARPLVNRNPAQTNRTYTAGHDSWR